MEKKDLGQKSCEKIIFAEEDSLVVATNLDLVMQFWLPTRGHLISKSPLGVFNSPKKPTIFVPEFLPYALKRGQTENKGTFYH